MRFQFQTGAPERCGSAPLRMLCLAAAVAALAATATSAAAQGSGQRAASLEVTVLVRDEAPRCDPPELRIPADANVDLQIRNQGTRAIAFRAPDWFKSGQVTAATNARAEANATGYIVAAGQTGRLMVKAPPAGQSQVTCADPAGGEGQTLTLSSVR